MNHYDKGVENEVNSLIEILRPFIAANIKEQTMFHHLLGMNDKTQTLMLKTIKGKSIFIFYVNKNMKFRSKSIIYFDLKIGHSKYISLYNKFIKFCHDNGTKIFSGYMQSVMEFSSNLKLIESIETMPLSKRKVDKETPFLDILPIEHAKITTPFETVTVYKTPQFSIHNGTIYLNEKFIFNSLGMDFLFERLTDDEEDIMAYAESFAQYLYIQHRDLIIDKLSKLYNIPTYEIDDWPSERIISYYPVLAMEMI